LGSELGLFGEFAIGFVERLPGRFERRRIGGTGSDAIELVLEGRLFERERIRSLGLFRQLAVGLR